MNIEFKANSAISPLFNIKAQSKVWRKEGPLEFSSVIIWIFYYLYTGLYIQFALVLESHYAMRSYFENRLVKIV